MFAIMVTEKGGEQRRLEFDKAEVTIGRVQGNDVILPKGNVSKRHARIVLKDGKFIIVDLKSTNGTYVNGRKITSPLVVKDSDKIYIGDFILGVEDNLRGATVQPPPSMTPPLMPSEPAPPPPAPEPPAPFSGGRAMAPTAPPPLADVPSSPLSATLPPPAPPSAPPSVAPSPVPAVKPPRPSPRSMPSQPPPSISPPHLSPPGGAPMPPSPSPSSPPLSMNSSAPSVPPSPPSSGEVAAIKPRLVGAGAAAAATRKPRPMTSPARRAPVVAPLDPKVVKLLDLQRQILEQLLPKLEIDAIALDRLGDEDLWQRAESAIIDLVETMDSSGDIPKYVDQDQLIKETLNEALGLGPLEDLLADDKIDEIAVDRRDRILVGKAGVLTGANTAFSSDDSFRRVVERLVAPTGQVIDEKHPFVDARLRDGSRLAAAVPPVAVRGACLTLRKAGSASSDLAMLIDGGALSGEMADFLTTCIAARRNVLVCGAPSSGKSAVLAALAAAVPEGERIVSVEEVAELALDRDDWIALESRPGDGNGLAPVDVATLLRGALRMRPDRLVVGDVRASEALELVQAMASSADGALASITGEGGRSALSRLAAMARMSAPGGAMEAMRDLVACAVDVVVHVARYADGVVRIAAIEEVLGVGDDGFQTRELFSFRGTEAGGYAAAGVVPSFYGELESRGIPADTSIFRS